MHSGIWIDVSIMRLRRTPAERMLLAAVCAIYAGEGECDLSNKDLATVIDIHKQSVSDLVKKLHADELIVAVVDKKQANRRTITPRPDLVEPYLQHVSGYKENPYSPQNDYQDFPYSNSEPYKEKPNSSAPYKENPDSGISQICIGSKEIPYSTTSSYKENPGSKLFEIPQSLDYQAAQSIVRRWKQVFAGIYIENSRLLVNNTITFSKAISSALVFIRATSISTHSTQVAETRQVVPHGAGFTVEGKQVTDVQLFDGLQMPGTTLERISEFMAAHPGRAYNDWVECRAIVSKWLRKTKPKPPTLSMAQRRLAFRGRLGEYYKTNPDKYETDVYRTFLAYWTEPDRKTGRTMRFESQKYFDIGLKLAYHFKHHYKPQHTFSNGKSSERTLGLVTEHELATGRIDGTETDNGGFDDPGTDTAGEAIDEGFGGSYGNVYLDLE